MRVVTDPALIAQLEGMASPASSPRIVTDPDLIAQLEAGGDEASPSAPNISKAESFGRGTMQGLTMGFGDELIGAARPIARKIVNAIEGEDAVLPDLSYEQARNMNRAGNAAAQKANPGWYTTGEVAGGVAAPVGALGKAKTVKQLAGAGAVLGGAASAGYSEASSPVELAKDTAKGAAVGAVLSPVIVKGVQALSRKLGPGLAQIMQDDGGSVSFRRDLRPDELSKAQTLVYRTLVEQEGFTAQEAADFVSQAGKVRDSGLSLTLPELADSQSLLQYQKVIGRSPSKGGDVLREFTEKRAKEQVPDAFDAFVKSNISKNTSPEVAGYKGQKAAEAVLDAATEKRTAAARPLYEKATRQVIPEEKAAPILKNPIIQKALQSIRNDAVYAGEITDLADNSVGVLDMVKRSLDDSIEAAKRAGENNRARLITKAKEELTSVVDEESPLYRQARLTFAKNSPTVDRITNSTVGVLKNLEEGQTGKAAQIVFKDSPAGIKYSRAMIRTADPQAWDDMVAAHFAEEFGKTTSPQTLYTRFNGPNEGYGKKGVIDKINAALSPDQVKAKDRFFGDLDRVLRVKYGSDTAFNVQTIEALDDALSSVGERAVAEIASGRRMGVTDIAAEAAIKGFDWFRSKIRGGQYEELARIFVGEGSDDFARKILSTKPGSPQHYMVMAQRITDVATRGAEREAGLASGKAANSTASNNATGDAATKPQPLRITIPNPAAKPVAGSKSTPQTGGGEANDLLGTISIAAQSYGVNPALMQRMAQVESSFNAKARNPNSSATGLFQFTGATWKDMVRKYGKEAGVKMGDINDPGAQARLGAILTRDNAVALQNALGRPATGGEAYIAHFMGLGGAKKLIAAKDSDAAAAQIFPAAAKANRTIFFDGKRPRSVNEVYNLIHGKMRGGSQRG